MPEASGKPEQEANVDISRRRPRESFRLAVRNCVDHPMSAVATKAFPTRLCPQPSSSQLSFVGQGIFGLGGGTDLVVRPISRAARRRNPGDNDRDPNSLRHCPFSGPSTGPG